MNFTAHSKKQLLAIVGTMSYAQANTIKCGRCVYTIPPQLDATLRSLDARKALKIRSIETATEARRKRLLTAIRKLSANTFRGG